MSSFLENREKGVAPACRKTIHLVLQYVSSAVCNKWAAGAAPTAREFNQFNEHPCDGFTGRVCYQRGCPIYSSSSLDISLLSTWPQGLLVCRSAGMSCREDRDCTQDNMVCRSGTHWSYKRTQFDTLRFLYLIENQVK